MRIKDKLVLSFESSSVSDVTSMRDSVSSPDDLQHSPGDRGTFLQQDLRLTLNSVHLVSSQRLH